MFQLNLGTASLHYNAKLKMIHLGIIGPYFPSLHNSKKLPNLPEFTLDINFDIC